MPRNLNILSDNDFGKYIYLLKLSKYLLKLSKKFRFLDLTCIPEIITYYIKTKTNEGEGDGDWQSGWREQASVWSVVTCSRYVTYIVCICGRRQRGDEEGCEECKCEGEVWPESSQEASSLEAASDHWWLMWARNLAKKGFVPCKWSPSGGSCPWLSRKPACTPHVDPTCKVDKWKCCSNRPFSNFWNSMVEKRFNSNSDDPPHNVSLQSLIPQETHFSWCKLASELFIFWRSVIYYGSPNLSFVPTFSSEIESLLLNPACAKCVFNRYWSFTLLLYL